MEMYRACMTCLPNKTYKSPLWSLSTPSSFSLAAKKANPSALVPATARFNKREEIKKKRTERIMLGYVSSRQVLMEKTSCHCERDKTQHGVSLHRFQRNPSEVSRDRTRSRDTLYKSLLNFSTWRKMNIVDSSWMSCWSTITTKNRKRNTCTQSV